MELIEILNQNIIQDESFNLFDSYNAVIKDLDPLIEIILDDNKVIKVEYYEH